MAGILRGNYPYLKTFDAIQLGSAIRAGVDVFVTKTNCDKTIGRSAEKIVKTCKSP